MFRQIVYWALFMWATYDGYVALITIRRVAVILGPSNAFRGNSLLFTFQLVEPILALLALILVAWRVISMLRTQRISAQPMTGFAFFLTWIAALFIALPLVSGVVTYLFKSSAFGFITALLLPWAVMFASPIATFAFVLCEVRARLPAKNDLPPNPSVNTDAPR